MLLARRVLVPKALVIVALGGITNCYGATPVDTRYTHTSGDSAPDAGNSNLPAVASIPAGGSAAQTLGPVGFTLSWEINPNECLQPAMGTGTTVLVTAACNGSQLQRWTWVHGKVINASTGGCLDMMSQSAGATVEVAGCKDSSVTQTWSNAYGNQFYQTFDGNNYVVAPTGQSTGDGVEFRMLQQAPATATREWIFGIDAPGSLQSGFTVVFAADTNMCLTAGDTGPLVEACGNASTAQLWNFSDGMFSQGSSCLSANGNAVVLAACDASQTAQSWWLGAGDVATQTSAGMSMYLFANADGSLTLVPSTTSNREWMFGTLSLE